MIKNITNIIRSTVALLRVPVVALVAIVPWVTSCKPTEKNYREAYDLAVAKRQQAADELKTEGLISADAPVSRVVDGDTLYFKSAVLQIRQGEGMIGNYNIAVDEFKMPTNARSGVEVLKEAGFDAFPAKSTGGRWYVIAGTSESLSAASALIRRFRAAYPAYPYIGLGRPVIIRN